VFGWQPFLESSFIHDSGDGVCMAILTKFCTALCWRRWSAVQVGHECRPEVLVLIRDPSSAVIPAQAGVHF